ncbi:hypothetical protein [Bosea sp. 124]|uniref:hypothetical protein n=1 Tax=Bosea sp. 124 TaxID=2135642 RepID=UPI000D3AE1E4|nr:hypothetical protein [Bosea sp. 124]PTM42717.1 hypothetical protein C8D03_4313 [Bosea sp. 124]
MDDDDYSDPVMTRLMQRSPEAREANFAKMVMWGAYNLVKVTAPTGGVLDHAAGYVTLQMEIREKTPLQIERALGLKVGTLALGARIYRLKHLPHKEEFEVRGYSSLPDGLRLQEGKETDAAGYPRGQMAWQIRLTHAVQVDLVKTLRSGQSFVPGLHPDIAARMPRR